MAFLVPPADLVESRQRLVGDTEVQERLDGLLASFQDGCIDLIERNMLIGLKKCIRLRSSEVVQAGVHSATLYNVLEIVIRLAMTDQIDFFAAQFSLILPGRNISYSCSVIRIPLVDDYE